MIVPSGKRIIMAAQNYEDVYGINSFKEDVTRNKLDEAFNKFNNTQIDESLDIKDDVSLDNKEESISSLEDVTKDKEEEFVPAPEKSESLDKDLNTYIFDILEGFGYPPRRLEQFSDDFIKEKMYSGGVREVEIVIPDRYYGKRTRIKDSDISKITKDIQSMFNLNFTEGERKNKSLIMKFTSDTTDNEEEGDADDVAGDILDEVYSGGSSAKGNKKAFTTSELLKIGREKLFESLFNDK